MHIRKSIVNWLNNFFWEDGKLSLNDASITRVYSEVYFKELAVLKVIKIIGGILSLCEFKTYIDGMEVKNEDYYRWNVRPNQNQSSASFRKRIITKLINDNEVLIISPNEHLYVADSFFRNEYTLYENTYTSVAVGDITFNRVFKESEVFYLSLDDENIKRFIDGVYQSYGDLLSASKESYLKNADDHFFLNISTTAYGSPKFQKQFKEMTGDKLKTFLKHGKTVLPVYEGYKFERDKGDQKGSGTTDFRELRKDIFSLVGETYNIPSSFMFGDTASLDDTVINNTLTFAFKPIAKHISEELTYKTFGKSSFLKGSYIDIDYSKVKFISILEMANAIDKILGSGVYCIDEVREKIGEKPLDTEWSKKHYMTKNYGTIDELLKDLDVKDIHLDNETFTKGGENDEV